MHSWSRKQLWWSITISLKISIIIPVFNESSVIETTLQNLQAIRNSIHELIVVDGGSDDNTQALAKPYVDQALSSNKGRAIQMNHGAAIATGDLLVFLHVDTLLDKQHITLLQQTFKAEPAWGRFSVQFDDQRWIFSIIAFCMNLRSRITGIATGDQVICVEKNLFTEVGGFPQLQLMEDIAISNKLRRIVKPICLSSPVKTSARRWQQRGIIRTILTMWYLRLAYFIGISPERLNRIYES